VDGVVNSVGDGAVEALLIGAGEVDDDVGSGGESGEDLDVHGHLDGGLRGFDAGGLELFGGELSAAGDEVEKLADLSGRGGGVAGIEFDDRDAWNGKIVGAAEGANV